MIELNDPNDSCFDLIRDIQRDKADRFIIEGENAISHALSYGVEIDTLFLDNDFHLKDKRVENIPNIYKTSRADFKSVLGFNFHRHAIALAKAKPFESLQTSRPPYLVLNGLTSPENVGTILRTAKAFGIRTIIFDQETCSPYLRRCIRVSIGHIFGLSIVKSNNLLNDIRELKKSSTKALALELSSDALNIDDVTFDKNMALILGSEGHGVSTQLLKECEQIVQIPMGHNIGSLNVSQSAAIALYQWFSKTQKHP